jgi:hypothetical protein
MRAYTRAKHRKSQYGTGYYTPDVSDDKLIGPVGHNVAHDRVVVNRLRGDGTFTRERLWPTR